MAAGRRACATDHGRKEPLTHYAKACLTEVTFGFKRPAQLRPNIAEETQAVPSAATDKSLDLTKILRDLKFPADSKGYILAFHSKVDDRPLHVDSILLAVKSKNG